MIVAYIKSEDKNLGISIVFPISLYIMHRCMVALKYGTLSPSEYRCVLSLN
jgi:hypothetical protein